jgi:hypothetical protein
LAIARRWFRAVRGDLRATARARLFPGGHSGQAQLPEGPRLVAILADVRRQRSAVCWPLCSRAEVTCPSIRRFRPPAVGPCSKWPAARSCWCTPIASNWRTKCSRTYIVT